MRPVKFTRGFIKTAPGSVLVEFGETRLICTVSAVESVPQFLEPAKSGWLTAEYAMLPASTHTRKSRERDRVDSRSLEIQRLIGRSLRAAVDMTAFTAMTLYVDCDVISADGGTRTAGVTGGWVAMCDALKWLKREERLIRCPLRDQIAAVSVGVVGGKPTVDLDYKLDSAADFDLNLILNSSKEIVEIQGTGEKNSVDFARLNELIGLGSKAIDELFFAQLSSLGVDSLQSLKESLF